MFNQINCHTTEILKYTDHHLKLHVKEIKSFVKDSTDFIHKINSIEKLFNNSILLNMIVHFLYTNILNKEGIEAVETTMKKKNTGTRSTATFLQHS